MFTVSYGIAMGAALLAGQLWGLTGLLALAFLPFVLAAVSVTLLGATLKLTEPVTRDP